MAVHKPDASEYVPDGQAEQVVRPGMLSAGLGDQDTWVYDPFDEFISVYIGRASGWDALCC